VEIKFTTEFTVIVNIITSLLFHLFILSTGKKMKQKLLNRTEDFISEILHTFDADTKIQGFHNYRFGIHRDHTSVASNL
jgi:hypothetical protein